MKKIIKYSIPIVLIYTIIVSCSNNGVQNQVTISHPSNNNQNINIQSNDIPGFNINQFANILKSTSNIEILTQEINKPNNSINNLDLDKDGIVDYLRIDQTGNNSLQIIDETSNTQKTVIATLDINPQNNSYVINGTPTYCGSNYIYNSPMGLSFGDFLFLSWWMSPIHYYHPWYHPYWGYHTHYYSGYRTSTYTRTTYRTNTYNANSIQRSNIYNSNTSQKSFSKNEGNRFRNTGSNVNGFKSNSNRSFGSSRSSFGGNRRR